MSGKRKIVITAALPYANGPVHIGHLVEHSMVDFWSRFQRMRGHDCHFICADDTHGTPVMVNARKQGITPEALVETARVEHIRDLNAFDINV